jgi:predicted flap endonuclease-1-like 5' DNA nuclease
LRRWRQRARAGCFSSVFKSREQAMAQLEMVEGIAGVYAAKLRAAGVKSTDALLNLGATPKGRQEIEENSGIAHKLILNWVNQCDLYRIKGVGAEYAELLVVSGVDTVPELAQRKAEHLRLRMCEANRKKRCVRQLPALPAVDRWIKQAQSLPRVVKY